MIRVTGKKIPFWYAVKGKEQTLATTAAVPVLTDAGRKRCDVTAGIVVLIDETQFGDPALSAQLVRDLVEHGGGGGTGILRVEWQNE